MLKQELEELFIPNSTECHCLYNRLHDYFALNHYDTCGAHFVFVFSSKKRKLWREVLAQTISADLKILLQT